MSVYNCILGIRLETMLDVVASSVHLKHNYHNLQGESVTINVNLVGEKNIYQTL